MVRNIALNTDVDKAYSVREHLRRLGDCPLIEGEGGIMIRPAGK
jgi:hypothetical protein